MKMKMPARQHSFLLKIIGILLVIINCTTITTVRAAPTPSIVEPFSSEFPLPDYTTNNNNNNENNNNNNNNYYEDSSNEMYYPEIEQNYQSINNWPWFKEYQRNYLKTYNHQRKYRPIVTRNTNKKYVYGGGGGGSSDDGRDNGINTAVDYDHLRIFDTEPAEELKFSKSITHNLLKNINLKKNNNYAMAPNGYMSLCHFKICNMGRKRNTRHT